SKIAWSNRFINRFGLDYLADWHCNDGEFIVDTVPVPLLALRTLKSDALVGISVDVAAKAKKVDSQW
ncbi:MAG: hypothetical protein Q9P44_13335, partial [Anaerolineae bacterium]|nr:hypothetical protein [Anaerolineae bacterium]